MVVGILRDALWGVPTVMLVAVFSVYFTLILLKTKKISFFGTLRDLRASLSKKTAKEGEVTPFSAAATALGGTVGVGSILGVGYAVSRGGAGSIFWMWVCSFFGMGLRYAEVHVALGGEKKGAHNRLREKGFLKTSAVFCVFCILSSFGTGNMIQTGSLSQMAAEWGTKGTTVGAVSALFLIFVLLGGKRRLTRINTFLVPACCLCYMLLCISVLWVGRERIPNAFLTILKDAFSGNSIFFGVSGAGFLTAVREGFARSVFSTEAGMGSSSLAHADAGDTTPDLQGKWGMAEIFFDTFVISTLTALMLLSAGGTDVTGAVREALGNIGVRLMMILTGVFGIGAVMSWCMYAESCIVFLGGGKKSLLLYRGLAVAAAFFGAVIPRGLLWEISDIFNALMLFPNLFLMFVCRKEIFGFDKEGNKKCGRKRI